MLSFAKKRMAKFLQVPCIPLNTFLDLWNPSEKRVLPFASQKRFSASLTVEAALVLPLFLFFAYAHIINPTTGWPSTGLMSVTVWGPSAEFANFLSTSMMVLGKKAGKKLLRQFPEYRADIVKDR